MAVRVSARGAGGLVNRGWQALIAWRGARGCARKGRPAGLHGDPDSLQDYAESRGEVTGDGTGGGAKGGGRYGAAHKQPWRTEP
jgi:hypothetical protein